MKRIIFALMTAIMLCTLAQGKNRTVTENDSLGNPKRVIELKDTMINGKSVTDTLSIMTYENSTHRHTESDNDYKSRNDAYDFGWNIGHNTREAIIAIVAIVSVFGLPLVVVFIVFFFRYKNRKAKYRLAEQALASGQPLPQRNQKCVCRYRTVHLPLGHYRRIRTGLHRTAHYVHRLRTSRHLLYATAQSPPK